MKIEIANFEDLEEILKLQKLSYVSEAELHNDYSIKPLTQTLKEVQEDFKRGIVLKAISKESNNIIGSVRAYSENNVTYIEKLIVHPDYQNNGIGRKLIEGIENYYPNERFELFTSHKSDKNLYLYNKCGYQEFKKEKVSDVFYFIYLRKENY
ncbi:acetyltransferase (GNAT) family protein [Methanobrevibacter cuticularis]|uniref:Acetyltransferase (GNAT) family protein n=1 Tax=Methanobrevibacter cuticularis TaxID=47311 RepID=A0A166FBK5_9EURY|nr:GNAT family N-acetyltransferase [Methanobrevibacter cuticularis]KZX17504.1 acetyltransferase (GNAT) family protein [Methanobrevibacter cuticularis]